MKHFCENTECEFNIVPCRPDTDRIKMPGGREIRRYGIESGRRQIFLCERCKGAVELVTDQAADRMLPERSEGHHLEEVKRFLLSAITAADDAPDSVSGSKAIENLPVCMRERARMPVRDLTGNRITMPLIEALVHLEDHLEEWTGDQPPPEVRIQRLPVPKRMKIRVPTEIEDLEAATNRLHRKMIRSALTLYKGNKSRVCEVLGISRTTLLKKMKQLEIDDQDQKNIQETAAL